jgi:DNA-binding NtrC family response regulator
VARLLDSRELSRRLALAPGLAPLSGRERTRLLGQARIRQLRAGEPLFTEGEEGREAYVILAGTLRITRDAGEGERASLALRSVGDWVGEIALVDGGRRSATVEADSTATVLEIPVAVFESLLDAHPRLGLELAAATARKLRESDSVLVQALRKQVRLLAGENRRLRDVADSDARLDSAGDEDLFPGVSPATQRVQRAVRAAGRSALPVLIQGEEGTGKAELALAIHTCSERTGGPWLRVDCETLSAGALEAELFGVASPAGTARAGLVEKTEGGTLYLAAVDALPPWVQGLVLHLVRAGEIRRVGDTRVRRVDVRLVSGSARDLVEASREGRFRGDLLEVLSLRRIDIPPLRERLEDLPILVESRLAGATGPGQAPVRFSRSALSALARHPFPGNQRELHALVDWIAERCQAGTEVTAHDLARLLPDVGEPWPEHYADALRAFKRHLLERALEKAGGNQAEAARLLGVHPANLVRMMRAFGPAKAARRRDR